MKNQNGSYLKHDGETGMKWGIRRWRNYDGTLTPEGKERYNYYQKNKATKAAADKAKDSPYGSNTLKGYQGDVGKYTKALDDMGYGVRRKDISMMTDEQLKKATDRARLESEYSKYYPTTVKTSTRQKLDKLLATTASVLAVGVTAATLYEKYQGIKGNAAAKEASKFAEDQANNFVNDIKNATVSDFLSEPEEIQSKILSKIGGATKVMAFKKSNITS